MLLASNPGNEVSEDEKISLFRCAKGMSMKKRNNVLLQVSNRSYNISMKIFPVVIFSCIAHERATLEELTKLMKRWKTFFSLRHRKLREHLPPESRRRIFENAD